MEIKEIKVGDFKLFFGDKKMDEGKIKIVIGRRKRLMEEEMDILEIDLSELYKKMKKFLFEFEETKIEKIIKFKKSNTTSLTELEKTLKKLEKEIIVKITEKREIRIKIEMKNIDEIVDEIISKVL